MSLSRLPFFFLLPAFVPLFPCFLAVFVFGVLILSVAMSCSARPSRTKDIFASVGADGSVRMFDLRSLEHSTIIYETHDLTPLMRLSWNKQDPNYLAAILTDSAKTVILDIRCACNEWTNAWSVVTCGSRPMLLEKHTNTRTQSPFADPSRGGS